MRVTIPSPARSAAAAALLLALLAAAAAASSAESPLPGADAVVGGAVAGTGTGAGAVFGGDSSLPHLSPRGGAHAAAGGATALRSPPPSNGTSAVLDDVPSAAAAAASAFRNQSCVATSSSSSSSAAAADGGAFVAPPATVAAATFVESSHGGHRTKAAALSAAATVEVAPPPPEVFDADVAARVEREEAFLDDDEEERVDVVSSSHDFAEEVERTPEEIEAEIEKLTEKKGGRLRVLFLSADTGGGHRASAESLAKSFQVHYPGTTCDLLDVWTPTRVWPYYTLVPAYKHMSAHPRQWKLFYHLSNNFFYEVAYDFHTWLTCERNVRRRIEAFEPDVVVSVHPTMNNVPMISTRKIAKKQGRDIPFFTVVTDFGSAHTTWFQKGVDGMFVASERIRKLAKRRGRVPDDKLVMSGLPIRHDFAVQAERLGDRTSEMGMAYQRAVREHLGVDADRKMVLVMGGGEGVGSLSDIVDGLYAKFRKAGTHATIYVVCGRNERLRNELATKCWDTVLHQSHLPKKKFHPLGFLRPHRSKRIQRALDKAHAKEKAEEAAGKYHAPGRVDVVGLGFVTNMAEYMVAADVLVTKAGPGTIAEAAAVGLPVMLTSFLPGQEAGNVNVVLDGGFGDYCEDPDGIADEVSCWLGDARLMTDMSRRAREVGHPHAASDIALEIGQITHRRKGGDEMN